MPGDSLAEFNQLIPCCGHFIWEEEGRCVILGCPSGVDLSVVTVGDRVTLTRGNRSAVATRSQWRDAILGFVDQIDAFYADSAPRAPIDDNELSAGWASFLREWRHRRHAGAQESVGFAD
ncbi:hypothetical protein [Herbiconiux sp. A18JL235]|uniref:Uncharacterized protein n=1 Tax=Herbiconiux sp. A18JL235 TaxID=3152363 RepID=A0AB39BLU0_9MICO